MTKRLRKEPSLNPKPTPPIPKSEGGAQMKKRLNRRRNTALGPKGTMKIEPKIKRDPPTLTKKVTAKKGHKYVKAGLATYHSGERIIANAENQKKREGVDARTRSGAGSPSTKFLICMLRGWKG